MLLVIDVGNTTTQIGILKDDKILNTWRYITKERRSSDETGMLIYSFLHNVKIEKDAIKGVIISSVVPSVNYSLLNGIRKYFGIKPIVVGPGIKTGLSILTDNPKEVGSDRIIDAVAAYNLYGGPCLVLNFGTATRYDLVSEDGNFFAAVTAPGIQISADALWSKAAQLYNIAIKKPDSILAKNTTTSMQAGLVYGYIGQVEYIVKKMKEESGLLNAKVIATGGYATVLVDETDVIDIYDKNLSLKGLKIIYDKNSNL